MRRTFAGDAEIVDGSHQAATKELLPDAVDHDPRRQRMLRRAIQRASSSRPLTREGIDGILDARDSQSPRGTAGPTS